MDKKEIFAQIKSVYGQSIEHPVNPFTVDNPDILVFNGRTLIGVFFPLTKELKNPDLLLRRLFMSRLSLSKTISTVLVLSEREVIELQNNRQIGQAFDIVFPFENVNDLLAFLSDNIRPQHIINPQLRRFRMRRFWGIIDYLEKTGILSGQYEMIGAPNILRIQSWSKPETQRYSRSVRYNHPFLITSKSQTRQSFMGRFEDIMTVSAMFNFTLSDGVLRANPEAIDSFMFLNIEGVDEVVRNTMNLRTLAFLGYVPGCVTSNFDIQGQRDRFWGFMSDKKYW